MGIIRLYFPEVTSHQLFEPPSQPSSTDHTALLVDAFAFRIITCSQANYVSTRCEIGFQIQTL